MQEFNLDPKIVTLTSVALFIFVGFMFFGIALPYLPGDAGNATVTQIVSFAFTGASGLLAIFTWLVLRKLRYADVVVDKDGIWYKHLGKEIGLVTWGRIAKVKERAPLQCLDLLGDEGERLLRVEYQLIEFEKLREFINERVRSAGDEYNRTRFSKSVFHHIFYLVLSVSICGLVWYIGENDEMLFAAVMAVLVVFLVYEYLTTAITLNIVENSIEISYPMRKKIISISNILDVQIIDDFHKGSRIPEVWIILNDTTKPIKIRRLEVDSNTLYTVLKKALK